MHGAFEPDSLAGQGEGSEEGLLRFLCPPLGRIER